MVFLFVLLIEFWRNVHLKAIVSTHFLHFTPFHFYSFSTLFERITRQLKDEKYLPPSKFIICGDSSSKVVSSFGLLFEA